MRGERDKDGENKGYGCGEKGKKKEKRKNGKKKIGRKERRWEEEIKVSEGCHGDEREKGKKEKIIKIK